MEIHNIRTFLPSKELNVSKNFYLDLGFSIMWESDDLIIFGDENNNFFLQNYYNKEWAENSMMQLHVKEIDDLFLLASDLIEKYEGTKIRDIFEADYGRTFHLIGPAGELWHITKYKK